MHRGLSHYQRRLIDILPAMVEDMIDFYTPLMDPMDAQVAAVILCVGVMWLGSDYFCPDP